MGAQSVSEYEVVNGVQAADAITKLVLQSILTADSWWVKSVGGQDVMGSSMHNHYHHVQSVHLEGCCTTDDLLSLKLVHKAYTMNQSRDIGADEDHCKAYILALMFNKVC